MITKQQECFTGADGNCNAMVLLSQQKNKTKATR